MTTELINYYSQHTAADPTLRAYCVGEQAATTVVGMAMRFRIVSVDIETAGLGELAFQVKCMIVATNTQSCVLDPRVESHRLAFREALSCAEILVFHNSAFDVPPLVAAGLMHLSDISKVFDTLVCARMAITGFAAKRGLADLERRYLSKVLRSATKDQFTGWAKINGLKKSEAFSIAGYDHPVYQLYAGWDGILTSMIHPYVIEDAIRQLTDHPFDRYGANYATAKYLIEREQRVNRAMLRRSARGLAIDPERIDTEQDQLRQRMNSLADELAEFNIPDPSNRNQLADCLSGAGALPDDYPTTKTGKLSTAKAHLDEITHPAAVAFRSHDQFRRLFTYLEHARLVAEQTDGRIHPECQVMHARTGRMAYRSPELHQFIADARTVITKDAEHSGLVSIDWSSIEPVLAANLAGDIGPIEDYEAGHKIYDAVSRYAGTSYKVSKVVLLAAMYGQGIGALAANLGVEHEDAISLQAQVFAAMPQTQRLVGWGTAWSEEFGKSWTLSGRIIDVDPERGYKGPNVTIQGSAYDVLAETVVAIDDAGLADGLYLTSHDECVVAAEIAHDVQQIMQRPPDRLCELTGRKPILRTDAAYLGDRWDDADRCPAWPLESAS